MRIRLSVLAALLSLAACQCGDLPTEGAARLELSYNGFHPGCLKVSVWDTAAPATTVERTLDVPAGPSGTFIIAVYRQASWSHTVGIRAAARELGCAGPEVAVKSTEVTIPPKATVPVSLSLVAADLDSDGYVAEANGGTDCRDDLVSVHPGAVELCNDLDENCDGTLNDGFDAGQDCPAGFCGRWTCSTDGGQECSATEVPWYPDLDHDSYGRADGGSVSSCGNPDGGYSTEPTDCDDDLANVNPGAVEICDGRDNNCDGTPDEGSNFGAVCTFGGCPQGTVACETDGGTYCDLPPSNWYYPDLDRDTYGATGSTRSVETCGAYGPDAGMSDDALDCDDTDAGVHPGAIEICDGIDNNCTAGIDETFNVGSACDGGTGTCNGVIACNGVDGGTTCNATPAVRYFVDDDIDGYGRPDSGMGFCSDPGAGWVDAGTDCDDGDPFTSPTAREICDRRDNNCNTQVDESGACSGTPSWAYHAVGAGAEDWETVAVYRDGGTGVWVASGPNSANKVRVKRAGAGSGTWVAKSDCSGAWYGSWADPRTGRVYLVGSNNKASRYDVEASNCVSTTAASGMADPRGVVGFGESPNALLYVASDSADTAVWDGGNSWSTFPSISNASFDDVHGISTGTLFAVGGRSSGTTATSPRIYRYDPANEDWNIETVPGSVTARLHSVWVVNPHLAYAVGSDPANNRDLIFVWDGTSWQNFGPGVPPGAHDLVGVLAFGRSQLYVVDDNGANSRVWEWDGGTWGDVVNSTNNNGKDLRAIAGTSPADIWVVGWDGTVIHWPD